jgi:type II restriction enzyme
MITDLPLRQACGYKSPTQIARVITEQWLQDNMYCPSCDSTHLDPTTPGTKVYDFQCDSCEERYQLKAKSTKFGRKLADSAYGPFKDAIEQDRAPSFFFLRYTRDAWKVLDLFTIPSHFFTINALEERRPLSKTARRSGWVGCNILLDRLPPDGWIEIIMDGSIRSTGAVRDEWQRFSFLNESTVRSRGWTSDVLRCLRKLDKREFMLKEMYDFEDELGELHPMNRHIRPKIRQQLQVLRDRAVLSFIGKGHYRTLE